MIMARSLKELLDKQNPEMVKRARKKADAMLLDIRLSELRERVNKTQTEIAETMGIKQPTLAAMEKPGHDPKISSIKRFIEAAGGKMRIDVEFPDGTHFGFPV